jgi:hypothetical protein
MDPLLYYYKSFFEGDSVWFLRNNEWLQGVIAESTEKVLVISFEEESGSRQEFILELIPPPRVIPVYHREEPSETKFLYNQYLLRYFNPPEVSRNICNASGSTSCLLVRPSTSPRAAFVVLDFAAVQPGIPRRDA